MASLGRGAGRKGRGGAPLQALWLLMSVLLAGAPALAAPEAPKPKPDAEIIADADQNAPPRSEKPAPAKAKPEKAKKTEAKSEPAPKAEPPAEDAVAAAAPAPVLRLGAQAARLEVAPFAQWLVVERTENGAPADAGNGEADLPALAPGPQLSVHLQSEAAIPLARVIVPMGGVRFREALLKLPDGAQWLAPVSAPGGHIGFAFTLPPGTAAELQLGTEAQADRFSAYLWDRQGFRIFLERRAAVLGLFQGVLLAAGGVLLALGLLSSNTAVLAAGGLGLAAYMVVAAAAGGLPLLADRLPTGQPGLTRIALAIFAAAGLAWLLYGSERPAPRDRERMILAGLGGVVLLAALLSIWVSWPLAPLAAGLVLVGSLGLLAMRHGQGDESVWRQLPAIALLFFAGMAAVATAMLPTRISWPMGETASLGLFLTAMLAAAYPALETLAAVSTGRPRPAAQRRPSPARVPDPAAEAGERAAGLALEAAREAAWDWDIASDKLHVSDHFEELLGLPAKALGRSGKDWTAHVHPEDAELFSTALSSYVAQGDVSFSLEFRMPAGDGSYRWLYLRGSCVPGDDGRAERCIGTVCDVSHRKELEQALIADAIHDRLTGLPNRVLLMDRLALALAEGGGAGAAIALFVIDIDRFNAINDGFGRPLGDRLLIALARRLEGVVLAGDTVARLGGDEFALLIRRPLDRAGAARLAADVQREIAKPIELDGRELFPSATIGVTLADANAAAADDLLHEAETALFQAKRAGLAETRIYSPAMRRGQSDSLSLDSDLRRALERGELALAYQPIMDLEDGRVAGFEALLRWQHPTRGQLSPKDFLGLAEETGLIVAAGRFALEEAARALEGWQTYFPLARPLFVSVNVSSRQLLDDRILDDVLKTLDGTKLAPSTLKLEITESLLMENPENAAGLLTKLAAAGVGVAIDDFGTGFSSLSYLQRFPADTIKIDRSFVTMMASDKEADVIVRSIVSLADALKVDVVAEGAESEADVEALKTIGCRFAQGFHFGAAMTAEEAQDFIARHWKD